jgi:hypothetical protein
MRLACFTFGQPKPEKAFQPVPFTNFADITRTSKGRRHRKPGDGRTGEGWGQKELVAEKSLSVPAKTGFAAEGGQD